MTPQALITYINTFGFQDTDQTAVLNALNTAIRSISNRQPWPFLQTVGTLTFDGTNPYPLTGPKTLGTDMRAVMKIIDTSSGQRVTYLGIDDMEEKHGSHLLDVGVPRYFYFEGTQLRVWQVPGATQTLRIRTLKRHPDVLITDPETAILIPPDFHENTIVPRALMMLYLLEDDPELAAPFKVLADEGLTQMADAMAMQQYDEPEYVHVLDMDDFDYDW